jgi:hypothetical protein
MSDYTYTSGIDESGNQSFWDKYKAWLAANAPGRGKYDKQIMKDPANSSLATASLASTARAQKLAEQNYTVDPEIAANAPGVLAAQLNKQKQDIASAGSADFMGALANAQQQAASRNLQRKMGIYGIESDAERANLESRDRMTIAKKKTNPWMAALGIASPFLSLIPGVGPALAAGAGAISSRG